MWTNISALPNSCHPATLYSLDSRVVPYADFSFLLNYSYGQLGINTWLSSRFCMVLLNHALRGVSCTFIINLRANSLKSIIYSLSKNDIKSSQRVRLNAALSGQKIKLLVLVNERLVHRTTCRSLPVRHTFDRPPLV